MSDRAYAKAQTQQKTLSGSSSKSSLLQRTCACGQHTIAGGKCDACRSEQSMLLRSRRAFGISSTPVAVQSNAPALENDTSFNSVFERASRFGHDFTRIPIHSMQPAVLQTKLKVNQPGDVYEQEADRVADQVMRMSASSLAQHTCACGAIAGPIGACAECAAKRKALQRQAAHQVPVITVPSLVTDVLNSGGRPLDAATRSFMESRFGQDFSHVKIHSDRRAAESAQAVNARAYTVGQDVVFGAGQYAPETIGEKD